MVILTSLDRAPVIPTGPPSPPPEGPTPEPSRQQVFYRPSLDRLLVLLRLKVDFFAREEQSGAFDHLVRSLGRDGLLAANADPEIVKGEVPLTLAKHVN